MGRVLLVDPAPGRLALLPFARPVAGKLPAPNILEDRFQPDALPRLVLFGEAGGDLLAVLLGATMITSISGGSEITRRKHR